MRGPSLIQRHLLWRGFRVWLLVRAFFAVALLMTLSPPTANGGVVALGVVSLSAAVGLLEVQRTKERVLMANLGVGMLALLGILALVPLVGEVALAVLLP